MTLQFNFAYEIWVIGEKCEVGMGGWRSLRNFKFAPVKSLAEVGIWTNIVVQIYLALCGL